MYEILSYGLLVSLVALPVAVVANVIVAKIWGKK